MLTGHHVVRMRYRPKMLQLARHVVETPAHERPGIWLQGVDKLGQDLIHGGDKEDGQGPATGANRNGRLSICFLERCGASSKDTNGFILGISYQTEDVVLNSLKSSRRDH